MHSLCNCKTEMAGQGGGEEIAFLNTGSSVVTREQA